VAEVPCEYEKGRCKIKPSLHSVEPIELRVSLLWAQSSGNTSIGIHVGDAESHPPNAVMSERGTFYRRRLICLAAPDGTPP